MLEADSNLRLPVNPPEVGQLVQVRQRTWLVEKVTQPPEPNHSARVTLACADDDAQGEELEVFWDCEPDRRILEAEAWSSLGARGFDTPCRFAAYVNTLRWSSVTATYTPWDVFETFPFPDEWQSHPDLEAAGKAYHDHRAALMVANDEGLTKTYNRFHDPYEPDPDSPRPKHIPHRYRWPDEVQNEVLARLLDPNTHRAAEERKTAERQETH